MPLPPSCRVGAGLCRHQHLVCSASPSGLCGIFKLAQLDMVPMFVQPKSPVMPASPQQPSVPNFKHFRKVHPLHRSPTMQWEPDSYKQANEAAEFMRLVCCAAHQICGR